MHDTESDLHWGWFGSEIETSVRLGQALFPKMFLESFYMYAVYPVFSF